MKVAVVGTGYVGLVTGTCLAVCGHDVTCIDLDTAKIEQLNAGEIPIHEPGLDDIVAELRALGRLKFTTDLHEAVRSAQVVFLAVGTPPRESGQADLQQLFIAVDMIAFDLQHRAVVVIKSTVPIGTNAEVAQRLERMRLQPIEVVSNPEFLREGSAVADCLEPDRIVVGVRQPRTVAVMRELYDVQLRRETPLLEMSPESAEMTKYAANSMLALKISFINEMANICDRIKANIADVRRGIGHDRRIGFHFLNAGVGYGGSCFPKDVRALNHVAVTHGYESLLLPAIDSVNDKQKTVLVDRILEQYGDDLSGLTFAVWGLAFKPETDDIREAPALALIDQLLDRGAKVCVHDPVAMPGVEAQYGKQLIYARDQWEAITQADGLVIMTEWDCYRDVPPGVLAMVMRKAVIFDGRGALDGRSMLEAGLTWIAIGQPTVSATAAEPPRIVDALSTVVLPEAMQPV